MIIYGSRNKELASEQILEKCPDCGTQNSIDMHVFQKYGHIFWLPMFPLGMHGVSQCDHCKVVHKNNKMPQNLRLAYYNVRAKAKTPIWMFSGLALLGLLIVYGIYGSNKDDERNKQLIVNLKPNDILQLKVPEGYTNAKITAVRGDSVFYKYNEFVVNKRSGLYKINNEGNSFSEEEEGATKKEMENKYTSKVIFKIIRNENN
jgi:hypothetical protein